MRVLITGGTGLIGRQLVSSLLNKKAHITVLTRNPSNILAMFNHQVLAITTLDGLADLNEYDAVINLAGEPIVNKRWSDKQKRILENSRWETTSCLTELFQKSDAPPAVFISGSAIGYYGRQNAQVINESFNNVHKEFSQALCQKWEEIALKAQSDKTRVCILRTGIVLSDQGGALGKMVLPFKLGLGGPIGDGCHYMSWIHIQDMVNAIMFLLENTHTSGAYNLTAPQPVTNKVFAKALSQKLSRPSFVITPKITLKLAMGEMADLLIYGQNVVPEKLTKQGFEFGYSDINNALDSLTL